MENEIARWFVLNFIPDKVARKDAAEQAVEIFNRNECRVELFAPTIVKMVMVDGRMVVRKSPLTYHYVFVKGTLSAVKELCLGSNGFRLLLNRAGQERYVMIDDKAMDDFRIVARAYENNLPFFKIGDIDLEEGDKVEVVDGKFAGLTGIYMPKKKSTSGNIYIAASHDLGTVVYDINAKYIRVLEFSKNSKRQYDLIDAFIPKLFSALRQFKAEGHLNAKEISVLTAFCRRMEIARLDNQKLEAKLLALLMCAFSILADRDAFANAAARFEKRKNSITNIWTDALAKLLQAVINDDHDMLLSGWDLIKMPEPRESKSQRELRDEYAHYLSLYAD